jgi:hypothetical protein
MPVEPLSGANTIVSSTGAAITATVETALFPVSQISIPSLDVRPGKVWKLTAGGIYTIGATGTLTITPRWGTTTSGITLGASVAQTTLVYSVTAGAWYMEAVMQCMSTSWQSGVHASFIATGAFHGAGVAATGGSQNTILFGGTAATGDPTLGGFFIGWTLSVAGSISPQFQLLQSLN